MNAVRGEEGEKDLCRVCVLQHVAGSSTVAERKHAERRELQECSVQQLRSLRASLQQDVHGRNTHHHTAHSKPKPVGNPESSRPKRPLNVQVEMSPQGWFQAVLLGTLHRLAVISWS